MCQWCRAAIVPLDEHPSLLGALLSTSSRFREYCGKLFHPECFEKLRLVAVRTGRPL